VLLWVRGDPGREFLPFEGPWFLLGVLVGVLVKWTWLRPDMETHLIGLSWRGTPRLLQMEPRERLVGLKECAVQYCYWFDVYRSSVAVILLSWKKFNPTRRLGL
jgi:hypothetical protein